MILQQGTYPIQHSMRHTYRRVAQMMSSPPVYKMPALPIPPILGTVQCIVQYADMHGSTQLALDTTPTQYTKLVTAFCIETTNIIRQYGGYPVRYVGDAVIAVYGGYSLYAADSALHSSIAIQRMVHHALGPAAERRIDTHISITYGSAVCVTYGDSMDILGAPVNMAAKMLSLQRPLIIHDTVQSRLHPKFTDIAIIRDADWPYGVLYEYTGGFHE